MKQLASMLFMLMIPLIYKAIKSKGAVEEEMAESAESAGAMHMMRPPKAFKVMAWVLIILGILGVVAVCICAILYINNFGNVAMVIPCFIVIILGLMISIFYHNNVTFAYSEYINYNTLFKGKKRISYEDIVGYSYRNGRFIIKANGLTYKIHAGAADARGLIVILRRNNVTEISVPAKFK